MKFLIEGQNIRPEGISHSVVSDSSNFIDCHFHFGVEWEGMVCVAQFTQGNTTYNQLLDKTGSCKLPVELVAGQIAISVFGQIAGSAVRATTKPYMIELKASGFVSDGDTAIPPTADLYSQLLETIDSTLKGEDGADGQDGADGINGIDGKDGVDGVDGKDGVDGADGLTTSVTLNGETLTQVDGNIDLGNLLSISTIDGLGTGAFIVDGTTVTGMLSGMIGVVATGGMTGVGLYFDTPAFLFADTSGNPEYMIFRGYGEDLPSGLLLADATNGLSVSPIATQDYVTSAISAAINAALGNDSQ